MIFFCSIKPLKKISMDYGYFIKIQKYLRYHVRIKKNCPFSASHATTNKQQP